MTDRSPFAGLVSALALGLLLPASGCRRGEEIVVFHAASLSQTLVEITRSYEARHADTRVRVEVSGSQVAARKVSELGMRADVVIVADDRVLQEIMLPAHASWTIQFAANELVLAHRDHSRYTEEITTENWAEVVSRPDVRLACVDPDLAPIGYRTVIALTLASEMAGDAGLSRRVLARCAPEHRMPHESEMLALLSARAVDYAFLYRSTAEQHHLKITGLPPEVNLRDPDRAPAYRKASTEVRMMANEAPVRVSGAPIIYGLTIPANAPNPRGAERFVTELLGGASEAVLLRSGFRPLLPARSTNRAALPQSLASLVREAP
jgi:molybdate/tungstate transport system substrate-binding protein